MLGVRHGDSRTLSRLPWVQFKCPLVYGVVCGHLDVTERLCSTPGNFTPGEGQSLHQGHRLGREQANPQPWVLGGRTLRAEAAAARGWEGAKTYAGGFCSRILLQKGIQDIYIFSF